MPLPFTLTLIRHGQSEQNQLFNLYHQGKIDYLKETLNQKDKEIHESLVRLTAKGRDQARITGEWLKENIFEPERFYVSPHVRTRETAALLGLGVYWNVDDRFREREWGTDGGLTEDYEPRMSPESKALQKQNPWLWTAAGGESLSTGTRTRVEMVMDSLHRKRNHTNHAIAVTHGEFIRTARFVIERMTPEEFAQESKGPNRGLLENCALIQYTRINPEKPQDTRDSYTWKRVICPWNSSCTENNGEWVELRRRPAYNDEELLAQISGYGHLFPDNDQ